MNIRRLSLLTDKRLECLRSSERKLCSSEEHLQAVKVLKRQKRKDWRILVLSMPKLLLRKSGRSLEFSRSANWLVFHIRHLESKLSPDFCLGNNISEVIDLGTQEERYRKQFRPSPPRLGDELRMTMASINSNSTPRTK